MSHHFKCQADRYPNSVSFDIKKHFMGTPASYSCIYPAFGLTPFIQHIRADVRAVGPGDDTECGAMSPITALNPTFQRAARTQVKSGAGEQESALTPGPSPQGRGEKEVGAIVFPGLASWANIMPCLWHWTTNGRRRARPRLKSCLAFGTERQMGGEGRGRGVVDGICRSLTVGGRVDTTRAAWFDIRAVARDESRGSVSAP